MSKSPGQISTGSKSTKRKHVTLSLLDKCKIIQRLEKGEAAVQLATEYNVGKSTISDIKKNKDRILTYVLTTEEGPNNRQTLKTSDFSLLDSAVYMWFLQERNRHTPISGDILKQKAKYFHSQIYSDQEFKASDGWLEKFKKRHGIWYLSISGQKLSSDVSTVESFQKTFLEKIFELNLTDDQIYNANESGLCWRSLPEKTLVYRSEASSALGQRMSKERVMIMPCANASGKHKLKLLMIGKSKNPRTFKNVCFPVLYRSQCKGWMNVKLFSNWFHNDFISSVKTYLKSQNLEQKALLLLANCPGYPPAEELISEDGNFTVMFLPPNCTPLLQPMDQNILQSIKLKYRKDLLLNVISRNCDVITSIKNINLKDVAFSVAAAWEAVEPEAIRTSWKKLWPSRIYQDNYVDIQNEEIQKVHDLVKNINPDVEISETDVIEWITGRTENEFEIESDADIINMTLQNELEDNDDEKELEEKKLKHEEAVDSFNMCIEWAKQNDMPFHKILLLMQFREEAFEKSLASKKQKKVCDFFTKK